MSLLEQLLGMGFRLVAEQPGREVVAVAIGQPWRAGRRHRVPCRLQSFDQPGYAKMALAFASDGACLVTETRVLSTDAASRRRFRLYWTMVRLWSCAIRRSWLSAARRRALVGRS